MSPLSDLVGAGPQLEAHFSVISAEIASAARLGPGTRMTADTAARLGQTDPDAAIAYLADPDKAWLAGAAGPVQATAGQALSSVRKEMDAVRRAPLLNGEQKREQLDALVRRRTEIAREAASTLELARPKQPARFDVREFLGKKTPPR